MHAGVLSRPRSTSTLGPHKAARRQVRNFVEGLMWIAVSLTVVMYGDGKEPLYELIKDADRVHQR